MSSKLNFKIKLVSVIIFLILLISLAFASEDIIDKTENNKEKKDLKEDKKEKEPLQNCTGDGKEDFFNSGFINLTKGNNSKLFYDKCLDENSLIEYLCKENDKKEIHYECEFGCLEGRCLTCEDLDDCIGDNETNETLVENCEDGTLINECNELGFRCIDLELVEDKSCIKLSQEIIPQNVIGIINYFYSKDMLIAKEYNGEINYLIYDNIGNLKLITDSNGDIVDTYEYYPYGNPVIYGEGEFKEKIFDRSTNLFYFGSRYYNPDLGKFTQLDQKINYKTSPYEGFNGNPINVIDKDGRLGVLIALKKSLDVVIRNSPSIIKKSSKETSISITKDLMNNKDISGNEIAETGSKKTVTSISEKLIENSDLGVVGKGTQVVVKGVVDNIWNEKEEKIEEDIFDTLSLLSSVNPSTRFAWMVLVEFPVLAYDNTLGELHRNSVVEEFFEKNPDLRAMRDSVNHHSLIYDKSVPKANKDLYKKIEKIKLDRMLKEAVSNGN